MSVDSMLESYLLVLMGPSAVGKTTILRYLETRWKVDTAPKYTTRPSRNTEEDRRDFIFCDRTTYPATGLLTFESYGNLFGIQLDMISQSLQRGTHHATIVGDGSVINRLLEFYPNRVVPILIFCNASLLHARIFAESGQRANRWPMVSEEIGNIYDQLGSVRFVIDNSGLVGQTHSQIDWLMSRLQSRSS